LKILVVQHAVLFGAVERWALAALPTMARFVFAATLLWYFWWSAWNKLEGGIFSLSLGSYAQIFPKRLEALGYDVSGFGFLERAVVLLGTWAEFVLPALILFGALTRLAALGMIGFVFVQSYVDIRGHGLDAMSVGAWFDRQSGSLILDQRAFWVFLLLVLVFRGAGPVSVDRLLGRRLQAWASAER